jgi:Arc/MetJ-type ribon-helix-helix transcriptional regulator
MYRMKERVTISVDPEALENLRAEVSTGEAHSLSVAVESALRARSKTQALREALELAEAEHGPVSKEMEEWAIRELMRASREASSSTPAR